MKKILIVDDSALMRRVMADIISKNEYIDTPDTAKNGVEALDLISKKKYDLILLDINMPKMGGIELLEKLNKLGRKEKIIIVSTDSAEGADVTIKALQLGAIDFVKKPVSSLDSTSSNFRQDLLDTVENIVNLKEFKNVTTMENAVVKKSISESKVNKTIKRANTIRAGTDYKKIVLIASSTGGPNALHMVLPMLPKNLDAPVVLVQHMPKGFTKTFSERLDAISEIAVSEAEDGEVLQKSHVYVARGGSHLKVDYGSPPKLYYTDEPTREGVKPCANYLFESVIDSGFEEIICVVMTGMGQDGTEGIKNLSEKNKIYVITQDKETSTIYGMPKAVDKAGLSNKSVPLSLLAKEIVNRVGIKNSK